MQTDEFWKITSINLNKRDININKVKYKFGNNELGRGAFGTVYPARRYTDGANVAIKVVSFAGNPSILSSLIDAFLNEVRVSKKLSSESANIVKIFDFDFDRSGLAFIVMEKGNQDLEKTLINKPTLPINRQKILWRQILNIIITLHRHSLVHMDLKPSNLVFFGDRLKLVDLGIAQKVNTRRYGSNGTYGFSAPEVHLIPNDVTSRCTSKADIWSVGAILYWINYGDAPKYDHNTGCHHPPSGISSLKDPYILDILRHTIRMDFRRRPDINWLAQHPFTISY